MPSLQVHTMSHTPTIGESIGQGFSSGVQQGIAAQLEDMLRQKQFHRDLTKALAEKGYKPEDISNIINNLQEPEQQSPITQRLQQPSQTQTQLQQLLSMNRPRSGQLQAGVGPVMQQFMPAAEEGQPYAQQIDNKASNSPQVERSMVESGNEAPVELTPEALRREENAIKQKYAKKLAQFTEGSDLWETVKDAEKEELTNLRQQSTAAAALEKNAREKAKAEMPTKEDLKFINDLNAAGNEAQNAMKLLDRVEKIVKGGHAGWLAGYTPESREARAEMEQLSIPIITALRRAMFGNRMTQLEFKKMIDDYIPKPGLTQDTNIGRIKGLRNIYEQTIARKEKLDSLRLPNGAYPKNIVGRLEEASEKKLNAEETVPKENVYSVGQKLDKLTNDFPVGTEVVDDKTGERLRFDGKKWTKVKENK